MPPDAADEQARPRPISVSVTPSTSTVLGVTLTFEEVNM